MAVPPGEHAFKLVIVKQDGSTFWEEGSDRSLAVAANGASLARGTPALRATCRFGDTAATGVEGAAAAEAAVQVRCCRRLVECSLSQNSCEQRGWALPATARSWMAALHMQVSAAWMPRRRHCQCKKHHVCHFF